MWRSVESNARACPWEPSAREPRVQPDRTKFFCLRRHQTGLVGRNQELEAPYERVVATVPEDCRSMFVTFSKGQPVERDDIFSYFREYVLHQLVDTCMIAL